MPTPAYVAAQLDIRDRERYNRYVTQFAATLAPYGGHLLVADEQPAVLSGSWDHDKFVLIGFDSADAATEWLDSQAYLAIALDREAATDTTAVLLAGL